MSLRWYTVVVDCVDVRRQAAWWRDVLGWDVVHEADDEVVLLPAGTTDDDVRRTPWAQRTTGLVFVPVPHGKEVKNRLHIDLAPHSSQDRDAEIERLLATGATRVDVGQSAEVSWDVLADPED
jgi:catechol 2,3-dioxygenase-like lactoylglutathione lyase family enzyme